MRLKCTFTCEAIPLSYHMLFVSLIKRSLELADEEYFKQIYYYQGRKNKQSKDFTFAVFLQGYQIKNDQFLLEKGVDFYISSPNKKFMLYLYNGLLKQRVFRYKEYELMRKRVDLVREYPITQSRIICQTMSPLYIKNKYNQALHPDQPEFAKELSYIADLTLRNSRGYGLQEPLHFTPIALRKVVVKEAIRDFQALTQKQYMLLDAYKGSFILEGNVEDLQYLYQTGVSFRRSSGYGMFQIREGG